MRLTSFLLFAFALILVVRANATPSFQHNFVASPSNHLPGGTVSDFKCKVVKNRVELNWTLSRNHTADRLVVQRSKDGKNFEMVGLVFGSEKQDTDDYKFYERSNTHKVSYRIIVIHKDESVEYSTVISTGKKK